MIARDTRGYYGDFETFIRKQLMANFKIAAAQIPSLRGGIEANTETHLKAIKAAAEKDVRYIVFPELSLTGYELDLAEKLALDIDDHRLEPFREASKVGNIIIVIGAPIKNDPLPYLAEIIFYPDGRSEVYAKINVHDSEEPYFCAGDQYHYVEIRSHKIASSICADLTNPDHVDQCAQSGATIYASGAFITPQGIDRDAEMLRSYSEKHNILTILSNFPQTEHRPDSAGQSGAWFGGKLLAASSNNLSELIIAEFDNDEWTAHICVI